MSFRLAASAAAYLRSTGSQFFAGARLHSRLYAESMLSFANVFGRKRALSEDIYVAAKSNRVNDLQRCLSRVQARPGVLNPELEWTDSDGMTPLIVASSLGHIDVVRKLMEHGANLRATSMRRDGGSPLHEAVSRGHTTVAVELFQRGANAFLENRYGQTAYDLAISRGNVTLLRRFERAARCVAWLDVKVSLCLGLTSGWKMVWAVLITREPSPTVPLERRVLHRQLLFYDDQTKATPRERLFVDGARVVPIVGDPLCLSQLMLHSAHGRPSVCAAKQTDGAWSVSLRACNREAAVLEYVTVLTNTINQHHRVPVGGGGQPAGGGGRSPGAWPPRSTPSASAGPSHSNAAGASSANLPQYPPPHYPAAHIYTPASAPSALRTPHRPGSSSGAESDEEYARRLQREELLRAGVTAQNSDLAEVLQAARKGGPRGGGGAHGTPSASVDFGQADSSTKPLRAVELDPVPSAPPAEPEHVDDDALCQLCLDKRKEMAFLHGGVCHECACVACATRWFNTKRTCPVCNEPAEQILRVYR